MIHHRSGYVPLSLCRHTRLRVHVCNLLHEHNGFGVLEKYFNCTTVLLNNPGTRLQLKSSWMCCFPMPYSFVSDKAVDYSSEDKAEVLLIFSPPSKVNLAFLPVFITGHFYVRKNFCASSLIYYVPSRGEQITTPFSKLYVYLSVPNNSLLSIYLKL